MPSFAELVSVIGPVGAVIMWIWLNRDKSLPPKNDDNAKIDEIHSRTLEILTILRERRG